MKMCPKCYTVEEGKPLDRNSFHIKEEEKKISYLEKQKSKLKKDYSDKIKEFKKYLNESTDKEKTVVWKNNIKAIEKELDNKTAEIITRIDVCKNNIKDLGSNKFIIKGYKCSVCGNIHSFKLN